jgi:hypothetical protein
VFARYDGEILHGSDKLERRPDWETRENSVRPVEALTRLGRE